MEETDPDMLIATCHTEGCANSGVPVLAPFYPNPTEPIYRAACGDCGQTITDITPPA